MQTCHMGGNLAAIRLMKIMSGNTPLPKIAPPAGVDPMIDRLTSMYVVSSLKTKKDGWREGG